MMYFYDPTSTACKSVTGGVCARRAVKFTVFTDASACEMVVRKDGVSDSCFLEMSACEGGFCCEFSPKEAGIYWYYFRLEHKDNLGAGEDLRAKRKSDPRPWQLSVYEEYETPDWIKNGMVYQIFPDRFCKSGECPAGKGKILHERWDELPVYLPDENGKVKNNDFFGGNFRGIEEKLPYLQSLGVTAVYLNPVFEAYSNHRYDTGDYEKFDSLLGTKEDFCSLVAAAEKVGIKIVLDGVFNHTGADSVYFNKYGNYPSLGAYQSEKSPYYPWYNFLSFPDRYASWWGFDTLPGVNENEPSYSEFIAGKEGVVASYTALGLGGWRLDVADELPDEFIKKLRRAVKAVNKSALLIGEVWEDASNKVSYNVRRKYFQGEELDGVTNYPFKAAAIRFAKERDAQFFANFVRMQIDHYPKQSLDVCLNVLGTHDTKRILTELADNTPKTSDKRTWAEFRLNETDYARAVGRLKIASLLQYTVPGVPCVYYGDEAGMQGFKDPLNRLPFPWGREDLVITEWYRFLGKLRKLPPFGGGEYRELYSDRRALIFERRKGECAVIVAVNCGSNEYYLRFDGKIYELVSGEECVGTAAVKPYSFGVYYTKKI